MTRVTLPPGPTMITMLINELNNRVGEGGQWGSGSRAAGAAASGGGRRAAQGRAVGVPGGGVEAGQDEGPAVGVIEPDEAEQGVGPEAVLVEAAGG